MMLPSFFEIIMLSCRLLKACTRPGAVAKRLCTGLQIRVGRFDSGPRLHHLERNQSLGLASQAEEVPPATTVLLDPCDPRRRRITILAIDELQE